MPPKARQNLLLVYVSQLSALAFPGHQTTWVVPCFLPPRHSEDTRHVDYTFPSECTPPNSSPPFFSSWLQTEKLWDSTTEELSLRLPACTCVWKFPVTWKSHVKKPGDNVYLGAREQNVLWNFIRKGHPKVLASKTHRWLLLPSGSSERQGLLRAVRKMNHGIKSFARGAGEESPRDNRQERAEVAN